MRHHHLAKLHKRWGEAVQPLLAEIDVQIRGLRGPQVHVSSYALIAGLVYLALEGRPVHLRALQRELAHARSRDLALLGLAKAPTYRQLRYRLDLLARHCNTTSNREQAVQQLLDLLVPLSAGPNHGTHTWAVDTHLFRAWANQQTSASCDPDATWRRMETAKHVNKPVLGYQLTAVVRAEGTEVCDRIRVITANANDSLAAVDAIKTMHATGYTVARILADRGFSQQPANFLDPLRNMGIHLTFDLKDNDIGVSGTYKGALVIDGWPHSPAVPESLRRIPKPGLSAKAEEKQKFHELMARRAMYAFAPHATPGAASARLASPAFRNRLRCRVVKNTAPDAAPTCRVPHRPDEACGLRTTTFTAASAPRTYQWPMWGSEEWVRTYAKRSAVERFFGHLQADHGPAFRAGRFRLRRLPKVALITAAFVIATNIALIDRAAERAQPLIT